MPASVEKAIKARGGAVRWRMTRKGKLRRCAITRKAGPRGGYTICYPVHKRA